MTRTGDDAGDERIVRIPLATGNPEGTNSAYLLPDRRAVVDPGPPGDDAWAELVAGIEGANLDVTDVEHVFVTHWHGDHTGSAVRLAEAAGADLYMHADDAPLVGDYAAARAERVERDRRRLRGWGVPEDVVRRITERDGRSSALPDSYPVRALDDGDRIAGLELLHTPGHTLGHAAFVVGADGADGADEAPGADGDYSGGDFGDETGGDHLLAGDALLPMYTPNVGGSDTRLADALATYLSTLDRICARAPADGWTVHPGHGSRVAYPERVEAIRAHHRERSERTVDAVRALGPAPATPWAVAEHLFGEMEGVHAKMGAGEAAAHLSWLDDGGRLDRTEEDGVARYRVV